MIRGLQITVRGEELSRRIAERIRMHEAMAGALDVRIKKREGDLPFDVRVEDGLKTLGELETERQHYRDRALCLTLLRDNVAAEETYVLDKTDLRVAELISPDGAVASEIAEDRRIEWPRTSTVDGLKLTMCGEEVRRHDHIDAAEVYRLGEADLAFAELMPEKPGWLEQAEYEERTSVGFYLGRLARKAERW